METDIERTEQAKRTGYSIVVVILAALLVYYAAISALSPSRKMKEIENEFGQGKAENVKIYSDSTYLALLKENAYMQAKTLMARTDSVYLSINLADSTADLEISGVVVHSARISRHKTSSILKNGDRYPIYTMLSRPMTIENSVATIRKEPLMIKIAPKDTSEYQPDIIPDTSLVEHVNFILDVSGGIRIHVYQEELDKPIKKGSTFRFDLSDRLNSASSSIKSAVQLKVPEYHPYIKIYIPREDVKIIYRALPVKGQIAVYTKN